MRKLSFMMLAALAVGCNPPKAEEPAPEAPKPNAAAPQAQATNGGSDVAPILPGSGAGPMTPVAGAENVQGSGGGGVGMAAKDMARGAAANQSNRQLPTDETE